VCKAGYAKSGSTCVVASSPGVPTTCAQADNLIGCCGPSNTNYYCATGATTVSSEVCPAGTVCGWGTDTTGDSYYGCVEGTASSVDPSGEYPIACQ
jgi:hypothetical protein